MAFASVACFGLPAAGAAQGFEAVGTRAQGMGSAFVAVADDASASWWNPAGLPGSLIFDGVADLMALNSGSQRPIEESSSPGQERAVLVAAAFPVAAVSYTRLHQWRYRPPPTAAGAAGRQEGGHAPTARSLLTHQFGVSFAQSLGDAIVVGVTTRVIRGGVSSAVGTGVDAGEDFDRAADAPRHSATRGDIDAGLLVRLARLRLGMTARNLAEPEFVGADGVAWRQPRRVRAGVAFVADGDRAGRHAWVIAADADLTSDDDAPGGWRGVGAGVERWLAGRRVALRGGVSASTVGETRAAATGGLSLAVPGGMFLEVSGVVGADERRGWGLGAHVMF